MLANTCKRFMVSPKRMTGMQKAGRWRSLESLVEAVLALNIEAALLFSQMHNGTLDRRDIRG